MKKPSLHYFFSALACVLFAIGILTVIFALIAYPNGDIGNWGILVISGLGGGMVSMLAAAIFFDK